MEPEGTSPCSQHPATGPYPKARYVKHFITRFFPYGEGVFNSPRNHQVAGPPFVGYSRRLIQYIRCYPRYL